MKKLNVAILGSGSRGTKFAGLLKKEPEKYEITALCDVNINQINTCISLNGLTDVKVFTSPGEFLENKYADVLIITTPDREHIPQAVKAMKLGYDIVLEKPLSDDREELQLLLKTHKETGRKVIVCHEFRYSPAIVKCTELLESGIIGNLYAIDATERVWYVHWAQAYVRGIGASIERAHPVILAKCSHDLDLIQSFAKSKCDTLSSVGDLRFFIPENAPKDSAYRCLDCKYQDECIYSAKKIYIDSWYEQGKPEFRWPFNKVSFVKPHTEENIRNGLRTGEYGICAFKCKVDKVDHQYVQMTFENGIKASLKMVYASDMGRLVVFYGTHGEIIFDERFDNIKVMPYGGKEENIDTRPLATEDQGHGGGDGILVKEIYEIIVNNKKALTPLIESIESQLMGIAAEESRKQGGKLVKVHKN